MSSISKANIFNQAFKRKNCCIIIPTYNNAGFIEALLNSVEEYCDDIIVVNDGCTDNTGEILSRFKSVSVIDLHKNSGKGAALMAGFRYALDKGFHYVITLDSDGQHFAKDIPTFLNALDSEPNAILVGSRLLNQKNVPNKNVFANKFSNFWFNIETGIKLEDTQSGYRLYPIKDLQDIKLFSGKYEFELEILVKASWNGIKVMCVPIDVFYPPEGERISHFRPFLDFLRITLLNTILVTLALLYYRPRTIIRKFSRKSLKQIIREEIIKGDTPKYMIALSIAFGVFMGIFPVWGYQLVIGFFVAHLLKLNKAIFFIAANISLPPMIPVILYLSYVAGSYAVGEGSWSVDAELNLESIKVNLKQYLLGAVVFATLAGVVIGSISYFILILIKRSK